MENYAILDGDIKVNQKIAKNNVVITGFGPFRDQLINPSWEAIKNPIKIDRPVNVIVEKIEVAYDTVDETIPKLWSKYKPILMIHVGLAAHDKTLRLETHARHGPYLHQDVKGCTPVSGFNTNQVPLKRDKEAIVDTNSILNMNANDANQLMDYINNKSDPLYHEQPLPLLYSLSSSDAPSAPAPEAPVSKDEQPLCTCLRLDLVMDKLRKAKEDGQIVLDVSQSFDAGLYVCEYIYLKSLSQDTRTVFIHVPHTDHCPLEEITKALKLAIECLVDIAAPST